MLAAAGVAGGTGLFEPLGGAVVGSVAAAVVAGPCSGSVVGRLPGPAQCCHQQHRLSTPVVAGIVAGSEVAAAAEVEVGNLQHK